MVTRLGNKRLVSSRRYSLNFGVLDALNATTTTTESASWCHMRKVSIDVSSKSQGKKKLERTLPRAADVSENCGSRVVHSILYPLVPGCKNDGDDDDEKGFIFIVACHYFMTHSILLF